MAAISNLGYAVYAGSSETQKAQIDRTVNNLRIRFNNDKSAIITYVYAVKATGKAENPYISATCWMLMCGHIDWTPPARDDEPKMIIVPAKASEGKSGFAQFIDGRWQAAREGVSA